MPSTYAHYRFGLGMLPKFPGDSRRTIQRFRRLYEVGLHGPDIFYYQLPGLNKASSFLGIKFHEQTGQEFFQRVCRGIRMERSEAAQADLYGVLCHYCLDSVLTPYMKEQSKAAEVTSLRLETEFDRFLLETDGKVPACSQDLSPHLKLTPGEWETVAKFYPPATSRMVKDTLNNMMFVLKLLATPEGARRTVLSKGVKLLARDFTGAVMDAEPDTKCEPLLQGVMEKYQEAESRFPAMLTQIQALMTYNAPLDENFAVTF